MKKILITGVLALGALTLSAQTQVVKEAERLMKSDAPIEKVLEVVTPAFNNPETSQQAITYYIPGKAGFKTYDKMYGVKSLGRLDPKAIPSMGKNLIEGYEYFMKALPLDQLPDEKGKVKPKYTKDIVNTIVGHYIDFNAVAIDLWGIEDYNGAYKAWDILLNMPKQEALAEELVKSKRVFPDSTLSEIYYNQALAAWQLQHLDSAYNAFMNAKELGYDKLNLYKYALSVASQANQNDKALKVAQEALPKYGKEEPLFFNFIINEYLKAKDYNKAFDMINAAIANEPNNAQYYLALGILYDNFVDGSSNDEATVKANMEKRYKAKDAFAKAAELDPNNAQGYYNLGRELCEIAYMLSDQGPSDANQINKYFNDTLKPAFQQAADALEKAYAIDKDNYDIVNYLENAYFNLHDDTNLKRVQAIKAAM